MLRGGTTCFGDMYFFPDRVADVAAETGIRAAVGMIAIDFPTPWATTPDEYFSKGLIVHDTFRSHPLVSTFFAPHAPYSVSDETLLRVRQLADELEVPVQMHVHETAQEVADAIAESGKRPLQRLEDLGLLTPAMMAVHATQLTDAEIEGLARSGSSVVHCPRSNLKLASGGCPVAALTSAGVNVALGTDGAAVTTGWICGPRSSLALCLASISLKMPKQFRPPALSKWQLSTGRERWALAIASVLWLRAKPLM
jgi:5-methylthioadenosine/S-adenosylhomocysteine deaminase